jgi:hypothetical protein
LSHSPTNTERRPKFYAQNYDVIGACLSKLPEAPPTDSQNTNKSSKYTEAQSGNKKYPNFNKKIGPFGKSSSGKKVELL